MTLLLSLLCLLVFAGPASAAVSLEPVGSFDGPVHVAAPPEDHTRLMVVEQGGTIQVVRGGRVQPRPFLDISDRVLSGGERGLLSVAFPPDYAASRYFYVYYTDQDGDIRIEEYRRSKDSADIADRTSARPLLDIPHRGAGNHNGGQLQFGSDGLLYAGTGDGGLANDAFHNAQNLTTLLGKLLRISPRPVGAAAYGIPRGNPLVSTPGARPEIWALGLRNPFRFSFDRASGDLTIGDVGQAAVEEVDFVPPLGRWWAGRQLRLAPVRGQHLSRGVRGGSAAGNLRPVLETFHGASGVCAITGGYVVRDPGLPSLLGRYVYGDNCAPALRSARLAQPRATDDRQVGLNVAGLSSFGEDAAGCVYVASLAGPVSRLVERTREVPCADRDAPILLIHAARRQRALRGGAVAVRAACSERCTLSASGTVRIGRKRYRLRKAGRVAGRGVAVKLRLKLTRRTRVVVRRALRRKRRVRATVAVGAVDGSNHRAKTRRATVRIRR